MKRKGVIKRKKESKKEKGKLTTRPPHPRKHTQHKPKPQPGDRNACNRFRPRIARVKLPRDKPPSAPEQPTEDWNPPREIVARDEEAEECIRGYTVD
jgi:hypothetical protein